MYDDHYDELERILGEGLKPYGITAENILEMRDRVRIIHHELHVNVVDGLLDCVGGIDIFVDEKYAFSIRKKVKQKEIDPGVSSLFFSYEMFKKGET